MFLSTSLFISLNSAEFCSKWIYGKEINTKQLQEIDSQDGSVEPKGQVVLTMGNFMLIWIVFQFSTTLYITFFVPEVDPAVEDENTRLKEEKKSKKLEIEMNTVKHARSSSTQRLCVSTMSSDESTTREGTEEDVILSRSTTELTS